VNIVDPMARASKIFVSSRESSLLATLRKYFWYMVGTKLSSLLLVIIEYFESTYFRPRHMSLHHILPPHERSTHEKLVIYLNKVTLTINYELVSGKNLKLLSLTIL